MAIIKKTLFPENLEKYNTFVRDTDSNSKYFNITELPDTLTGGKNAFLIQGSEYLVPDTLIKIEIKDSEGNIIYHEPGEGIISASVGGEPIVTEYYEGVSKVVSVYVYPDTKYGPATITILGELSRYDNNGLLTPIPLDWQGTYNVKWQKQININPALPNVTKIRFYRRPVATINEILSPLYSIVDDVKVASAVTQSFANIKLSNLETFAGDVKRVKVFRTSQGDISDYDLIQDILVESKELLTTYNLSGSVVGNAGIFTSEVLRTQWNSGSLNATSNTSRIEAGVRLTGSGYFTYTQSLDLKSTNTYELNLDTFYSASIDSNLGIYLVSGSASSSIATLYGTQPTKNFSDTTIPFKLTQDYPTASLYFSQSQGEWHIGNVSLKLSEDTAFSPDEISFVTTMPTVLGNETYNFKFEFYDVNNNYVPVAVTQSATFNGGNTNIGGTILLISSSTSSSLEALYRVSSSISGTVTYNSSSISGSLTNVSSSVSGTITYISSSVSGSITTLSGSVSQSVALTLSSSLSKVKLLADGGYPGTFIESSSIYSPNIAGQSGYISGKFQVGATNPIILDATTSTRKIYIGNGTGSNANTSVYLDSAGQFSLADKLTWNGSSLSVNGSINVTGGNAATTAALTSSISTINSNVTNVQSQLTDIGSASGSWVNPSSYKFGGNGFTLASLTPSGAGLHLGSNYLGYYDGGAWKSYMNSSGQFYLAGAGNNGLSWNGSDLSIDGTITARAGYIGNGSSGFTINSGYIGNGKTTLTDSNAGVYIGTNGIALGANSAFKVDSSGNITATTGTFGGTLSGASGTFTGTLSAATGSFGGAITAAEGTIGGWTIGPTSLYKENAIYLDATAKQITITDTSGAPKVTINQNSSFTNYAAGFSSGTQTYTGTSAGSTWGTTNTAVLYSFSTTSGRIYNFTATETSTNGTTAISISGGTAYALTNTYRIYARKSTDNSVKYTALSDSAGAYGGVTVAYFGGYGYSSGVTFTGDGDTYEVIVEATSNFAASGYRSISSFYFPSFSYRIEEISTYTEIINAGIQTGYSSTRYVKLDRSATDNMLQVGGNIVATGNIIAYYSDKRLKNILDNIDNPLDKINKLNGVYYQQNDLAREHGIVGKSMEVGLIAQEVEEVLPEVVSLAAFDIDPKTNKSISGENYLTIDYSKIVPLLVEGIKELKKEIEELKKNK